MTSGHGLLNFTVRYVRARGGTEKEGPCKLSLLKDQYLHQSGVQRWLILGLDTAATSPDQIFLLLCLPLYVCVRVYVRPSLLTRIPLLFLPTRRTDQSSNAVMVHSAPCFLACSAKIQYLLYLNALVSNLLLATAVFDALFRESTLFRMRKKTQEGDILWPLGTVCCLLKHPSLTKYICNQLI